MVVFGLVFPLTKQPGSPFLIRKTGLFSCINIPKICEINKHPFFCTAYGILICAIIKLNSFFTIIIKTHRAAITPHEQN